MIVLDTNVLSELMAVNPSPAVRTWLDRQKPEDVWTTSITTYEIELGIALMPLGKKRAALEEMMFQVMMWPLKHRVLPFGYEASQMTAALTVKRRRAGKPIGLADAQIAGIVAANSATLV